MFVSPQNKSVFKVPLQAVLIVPFVLEVVLVVGLVGYLSFQNGQQAVNQVAQQLRGRVNAQIESHVRSILNTPHRITQSNANVIKHGLIDPEDQSVLEQYFWEQVQVFSSVTSIYFGNTKGGLANAGREGATESLYVIGTDGFTRGNFRKYATDSQGHRTELLSTVSDFDARTRPWYTGAVEKGETTWSEVYILFTGQDMAISASRPVYDDQHKLLGVVSVDLFLSQLSDFLAEIEIGQTGQSVIVERSGLLIATSTGEKLFVTPDGAQPQRRVAASQSTSPLIRGAMEALTQQFGDYQAIATAQQFEFMLDGQRHFMQVTPVQNQYGLDWLIVTVIPEADFMSEINANYRITRLLIGAALIVAVVIGILTARLISGPISRLNTSAQALAQGQWSQVTGPTWINEIGELTGSFNAMSRQLQQSLESLTAESAELRQTEAALRQSELRLALATRGAGMGIWDYYIPEDRLEWDDRMFELFDTPKETFRHTFEDWSRCVLPEALPQVLVDFEAALRGEQGFATDFPIRKQDGSVCYVAGSGIVIRSDQGDPVRMVGINYDITKRKQAEEALRESEERSRVIFETLAEGVALNEIVCNDAGEMIDYKILEVNDAFYKLSGLNEESMVIGNMATDLYKMSSEGIKTFWENHKNSNETTKTELTSPVSGRTFSVLTSPFKNNQFVTSFRDITERKRAEEALRVSESKFRQLVETISDVIFEVDEQGFITYISPVGLHIWGGSLHEIIGKNFIELIHPEDRGLLIKRFSELGQGVEHPETYRFVNKVGDVLWVRSLTSPIIENGKFKGARGTLSDITAQKQAEKDRLKLEKWLLQFEKAESLSRMAGAIAHHFNNQLQTVMGHLELAMTGAQYQASGKNLPQAMIAARQAAEMSSLMLLYLGQTSDNLEPLDLAETCVWSLASLRETIPPDVTLNLDMPPSGPVINANATRIQQLLTNLITNAFEAIGDSPGIIDLAVKTVSAAEVLTSHHFPLDWQPQDDQTYACLEVTDTGSGISDEDIDKLFDPFFSTKFTGRGLGLAVVLGIIRTHSGTVTVTSNPGRGSTFRIFFPVSTQAVSSQQLGQEIHTPDMAEGGGTVLLVEDEEMVRYIVTEMLTSLGFTVLTASDGVEAVALFRQHQTDIDCVLCDLTMPRMDGWETLIALRQLSPDLPVILSSGYDEAQVMTGHHPEHPQAFLSKPYQMSKVNQVIRHIMGAARQTD